MSTVVTDEEVRNNLGCNLQRLLVSRGMTQHDLALATGESDVQISRICRGIHVPNAAAVARIAAALDASIDRLLGPPPEIISKTG